MKPEIMHLFVTNKCTNKCPLCCNNNFDIEKVPVPTEEELSSISTVCLTGGDPFLLDSKLDNIVNALRSRENIKNIYVFTSGYACLLYLKKFDMLPNIDGVTFSPKSERDYDAIWQCINNYTLDFNKLSSNRLYVFIDKYDDCNYTIDNSKLYLIADAKDYLNCQVFLRTWVEDFSSPENEIFRRL